MVLHKSTKGKGLFPFFHSNTYLQCYGIDVFRIVLFWHCNEYSTISAFVSFRQDVNDTTHGKDDRVFLIGASSNHYEVGKIIQLSLNTFEEHEVIDIPNISARGIVRIERMSHFNASIFDVDWMFEFLPYLLFYL